MSQQEAGDGVVADGVVAMTEEQRFLFDLKGWICIPEVLTPAQTKACREHVLRLKNDPESLDPLERYSYSGPAQVLLDHPVVVGVLREVIEADRSEDCYGFRCESSFSMVRSYGQTGPEPHGGRNAGPLGYQVYRDRIYSGLTRVAWELNPVEEGDNPTAFISGTHKMNFPLPEGHKNNDSPLLETYTCPAGSVVIFSENTTHAGLTWQSQKRDRVAVFNCYSAGLTQYHKMNLPAAVVEAMPPKRQTLFRGVWHHNFHDKQPNDYFAADNMAL